MRVLSLLFGLLILFPLLPFNSVANQLAEFTTDGCSMFPDGTLSNPTLWQACCIAHDVAYWQGGTIENRLTADNELKVCVAKLGQPEIAQLMMLGVRVGGTPYLPTPFRWGYGWPFPKGYGKLTDIERALVKQKAPR